MPITRGHLQVQLTVAFYVHYPWKYFSWKEAAFIEFAKESGVGIAAAWEAVAPNFIKARRKEGLFVRLYFPAYEPNKIEWGISKLKEIAELFCWWNTVKPRRSGLLSIDFERKKAVAQIHQMLFLQRFGKLVVSVPDGLKDIFMICNNLSWSFNAFIEPISIIFSR